MKYKVVSSLAELFAALDPARKIFCDTETIGLYGKVRLFQAYQPHLPEVLIVEWPNELQLAAELSKFHSVWQNAHYDITTIQAQTSTRWIPEKLDDTFLLARLALPRLESFSLDAIMTHVLGYDPYAKQGLDKKKLQGADWSKSILSPQQLAYAATDVWHLPTVYDAVRTADSMFSYKLDMTTLRHCLDFQWNGMPVDYDRLQELREKQNTIIKDLAMPINVNSWKQVRPYIGENESDDIALARFEHEGNTKAGNVRKARKALKMLSFLSKFDNIEGRIFGKFKPSAKSGRLTSADQNLQQLPRAAKCCFGYKPGEGKVLVFADFAQLELRTICAIVNCTLMAKKFYDGEDLHGFTASMIFGKDWTKQQRQITKTYNFNLLYGGGIAMILTILLKSADLVIPEHEANRARAKWRNLWREIYAWQQAGIQKWTQGKLGSTPLGRPYLADMMTDYLNIENQGAGAEVACLALHYLQPVLKQYNAALTNFIHDSYIIECDDDPAVYVPVAEGLAKAMKEAWAECSRHFKIKDLPMPVEVKVGYNWGDIEADKDLLWSEKL